MGVACTTPAVRCPPASSRNGRLEGALLLLLAESRSLCRRPSVEVLSLRVDQLLLNATGAVSLCDREALRASVHLG